jgi:hypothetical protein
VELSLALGILPSELAARITHADKVKFSAYTAKYGPLAPWRQNDYPAAMLVQYMYAVAGAKPPQLADLLPHMRSDHEETPE